MSIALTTVPSRLPVIDGAQFTKSRTVGERALPCFDAATAHGIGCSGEHTAFLFDAHAADSETW